MGVKRLWEIVSPCGRRVSIETIRGKVTCHSAFAVCKPWSSSSTVQVLAVDASIWLTQFIKAMRDDEGRVLANAHLLGVFRRVCKVSKSCALSCLVFDMYSNQLQLLFHRVKPVFVFDGGTPALKRKEVLRRRQHREAGVSEASNFVRAARRVDQLRRKCNARELHKSCC